jgi:glycosyltransferase involved in cell wall biosynthesis
MIADTPPEFAKTVMQLLKDKKLRERISRNARQLVEKRYDWLEIGQRLIAVYDDLVNNKG